MSHIGQAVGVTYHHTVVVRQHLRMIYVRLIITLVVLLPVAQHLRWSALQSLGSYATFLT